MTQLSDLTLSNHSIQTRNQTIPVTDAFLQHGDHAGLERAALLVLDGARVVPRVGRRDVPDDDGLGVVAVERGSVPVLTDAAHPAGLGGDSIEHILP